MATASYPFPSSSEGWSFTDTSANPSLAGLTAAWSGTEGNPAGSLQVAQSLSASQAGSGHWQISGTWESFGVPPGSTVNTVQLSVDERIVTNAAGSVVLGADDLANGSGTSQGILIGSRSSSGTDSSYVTRSGSVLTVPSGLQASTATVVFRLPVTIGGGSFGGQVNLDNVAMTVVVSSGTITGDPYLVPLEGGAAWSFEGVSGRSYLAAGDDSVEVGFRIADVPGSPGRQMVDLVEVKGEGFRVEVGLMSALLNTRPLVFAGPDTVIGLASVRYWRGAGGEPRVDVRAGEWAIAIIQDDGSSRSLHGDGPLDRVTHLGLFVDTHPSETSKLRGLLVTGKAGCEPEDYLLNLA